MFKLRHLLLLVLIAFSCYALADKCLDFNTLLNDLEQVSEAIDAGKIDAAERILERIKQKIKWEENGGLEYPNIVRNTILSLQSLIREESGKYEYYAGVEGPVVEIHYGPAYLYLVVQTGQNTMTFLTDAGLVLDEDACRVEAGASIVVYYESIDEDLSKAVKIVCKKK